MCQFLTATILLIGSLAGGASAALVISNWNITGNTLTYDITDTIDVGANIGSISPNRLFIGVPGDTDWVIANGVVSSVVNNPGHTRIVKTPRYLNSVTVELSDYTWLDTADFQPYAAGDVLNASVTAVGGTLIGANIVREDIIVAAGRSTSVSAGPAPQVAHFAGAYIPEPASVVLLGLGGFGLMLRRSRR